MIESQALERIAPLRERMARACRRAGREASEVLLIGAAKTVASERLLPFIQSGLHDVGENYVQEGVAKVQRIGRERATWHFIGSLQRNKAREAVTHFDWIHSVDRLPLARSLDEAARAAGKVQRVLLQVNLGEESSKAGCAPHAVLELARACAELENLQIEGLMGLPPYHPDAQMMRPFFKRLRRLRDEVREASGQSTLKHLSMGMTNDFEVALEEGATMVRVGTALFGERVSQK
ncbi:MAG: dependent protein [Abditibacteriota bacterium]|nr:dependent protein [Abditibacteriota bacterium]